MELGHGFVPRIDALCVPKNGSDVRLTAHLGAVNEAALALAMDQVVSECALLVIAHPYSAAIRSADNIVVLDGGVVAAAGTNEEYSS